MQETRERGTEVDGRVTPREVDPSGIWACAEAILPHEIVGGPMRKECVCELYVASLRGYSSRYCELLVDG
jgi:hypothetical protein